jgi:cyclophilin family peptidyl-prolyl cis-trans isomerase
MNDVIVGRQTPDATPTVLNFSSPLQQLLGSTSLFQIFVYVFKVFVCSNRLYTFFRSKHTVFGRVVSGQNVVKQMEKMCVGVCHEFAIDDFSHVTFDLISIIGVANQVVLRAQSSLKTAANCDLQLINAAQNKSVSHFYSIIIEFV